jgi:CheY-like chemotaxis protein
MTSKKILIVDDESVIRELVRVCLEDLAGWQVTTASSAKLGLIEIGKHPPDAILLDITMPEMDGLSFLQEFKGNTVNSSIPVIFLTAKTEFSDLQKLSSLGVAGTILKPFDPIAIVDKISTLLGWNVEPQF